MREIFQSSLPIGIIYVITSGKKLLAKLTFAGKFLRTVRMLLSLMQLNSMQAQRLVSKITHFTGVLAYIGRGYSTPPACTLDCKFQHPY